MRSLFSSLLSYFLTPAGLIVLGALDSSLIFFLPFGIDFVLILMTARDPNLFWAYALGATAGSILGATFTYWVGRKLGEQGLGRWLGESRLERVRRQVTQRASAAVALLGLIPPPFPFTALLLAAGAFGLHPWQFLTTLAAVRFARFLAESALAARYGEGILGWMESTTFEMVVGALILISIAGTVLSAVKAIRAT